MQNVPSTGLRCGACSGVRVALQTTVGVSLSDRSVPKLACVQIGLSSTSRRVKNVKIKYGSESGRKLMCMPSCLVLNYYRKHNVHALVSVTSYLGLGKSPREREKITDLAVSELDSIAEGE